SDLPENLDKSIAHQEIGACPRSCGEIGACPRIMDATHSTDLKSWVESANDPAGDFPIQNLPFGVFRRKGSAERPRGGIAIGDQVFDLAALGIKTGPTLNSLAAAGRPAWRGLRKQLSKLLSVRGYQKKLVKHLVPMKKAELFLPVAIGDYSDF